jgi:hypothetical protein
MGMDSPRLAVLAAAPKTSRLLEVTHQWYSGGLMKSHVERIETPAVNRTYRIDTGSGSNIVNHAFILYCPPEWNR